MKFDEAVKLDNFKAQYDSILSNITIANTDLESVLRSEDAAKSRVADLNITITELTAEVKRLSGIRTQILIESDETKKKAVDATAASNRRAKEIDQKEVDSHKEVARLRSELEREVEGAHTYLHTLQNGIPELEKTYGLLSDKVQSASKQLADITSGITKLSRQHDALAQDLNDKTTEHKKLMDKHSQELLDVMASVEKAKAGLVDAREYWDKKEREMTDREKSVLIVTRRLQQLFQEIKPGVALKI